MFKEVTFKSRDGLTLFGRFHAGRNRAVIILIHGLGGAGTDMLVHASFLVDAGYGVFMIDLRAHGSSDGDTSTYGLREADDVAGAVDYLLSRVDVNGAKIGALGFSLGAQAALRGALKTDKIRALVLDGLSPARLSDHGGSPRSIQRWLNLPFNWLYYRIYEYMIRGRDAGVLEVSGRIAPRPIQARHQMPDLSDALKFQKKMTPAEAAYLKQMRAYRTETRKVLLDILARVGVTRVGVRQMVNAIAEVSRNIQTPCSASSRGGRKHGANYMRRNAEMARRAKLTDSADIAPVLNAGSQIAQDGEQCYMTNTSAWISQLETSLQTQAAKLRISNASRDEQIDRLLSENLADGRASVWLANTNQAASEETTNLWTYGVGLLGAYLSIYNEQQGET